MATSVGRKRSGAPDAKYFDMNETVAKFDSVRQWLLKNCKKVKVLGKMLPSHLVYLIYEIFVLIGAHLSMSRQTLLPTSSCLPSRAPCYSSRRYVDYCREFGLNTCACSELKK